MRGTEGRPGVISSPSVQTHVCALGPRYLPRQHQQPTLLLDPHTPPVPTPYPQVALPLENTAQPPTLPHHPLLASRPIHVPRTPMPATLGQSLPTPWAICQGDGSFSKKQEHLPPSWPSCLLGFCHR